MRLPDVGESIGIYRLDREVARGGMGVVFEAADTQLDRTVAIKVISPVFADDEEYRRRFLREASSLAKADSPHIVSIYSYGEHAACLYIAMQYVGGGDLRAAIGNGPLSLADTVKVVADVATGLADAHDVGVLHRDVKPRNVLLRRSPRRPHAYLCDFGVAKADAGQTTVTGAVTGTLAYVAPEMFDGGPPNTSTDLYALGCLMWECLTGSPPYTGEVAQVIAGAVGGPIPQLDGQQGSVQQVNLLLLGLLAKKPEDRLSNAHDVAHRLQQIAEVLPRTTRAVAQEATPHAVSEPATDIHSAVTLLKHGRVDPVTVAGPLRVTPTDDAAPTVARLGMTPGTSAGTVPTEAATTHPPSRSRRVLVVVAVLFLLGMVGGGGAWSLVALNRDSGSSADPGSTPSDGPRAGNTGEETPKHSARSTTGADVRAVAGDLTGDGRGDLAVVTDNSAGVQVVPVVGGQTSVVAGEPRTEPAQESLQGDFDGDGDFDVAALTPAGEVWVSNGWAPTDDRLLEYRRWTSKLPDVRATVSSGDFNGDGRWDLALTSAFKQRLRSVVMLSDGVSFKRAISWIPERTSYEGTPRFIAGDFTGDGLHDLVEIDDLGGRSDVRMLASTGDGFMPAERWYAQSGWTTETMRPVTGDFNGDSQADLAVVEDDAEAEIHMLTSNGRGFDDVGTSPLGSGYAYTVPVASDIDGDRTTDLVLVTPGPSYRVLSPRGSKFVASSVVEVFGVPAKFAVIGRGTYVDFD